MLGRLRKFVDDLVEPLGKLVASSGVSPNALTVLGFMVNGIAMVAFFQKKLLVASGLALLGGFLDLIDGVVARISKKESIFGGILDSTLDRFSDFFLLIGMGALIPDDSCRWALVALAIHASLMPSYIRARAKGEGLSEITVGLVERPERLIIISVSAALNVPKIGLLLLIVLGYITTFMRLIVSYKRAKDEQLSS
ncbi:MAG: CDP-alcohol phosphatidyltransferase family protein [Thermoproteota archaeon]|nr:MAG: CDP-alcohol phosphatidyltransferase family protein [Candidatus Korarchaeota archaeon]